METPQKDPNAVALGKKGGTARAVSMTPAQRSKAARRAIKERWRKYYEANPDKKKGRKR